MRKTLIGLLAPALLSAAAASQTVVVRPLPFTGVPRILPNPAAGLPLMPVRLPSPVLTPQATLSAALPAVKMDARQELPVLIRTLPSLRAQLEEKTAAPAPKPEQALPLLERLFDGREITLPEDDLERELGLK